MRKFLFFTLLALSSQVALVSGAAAASTPVTVPQASGGLKLSLTTSGFQFTPLIGSLVPIGPTPEVKGAVVPIVPQDQGFSASVALSNHTGQDIAFQLSPTGAASSSPFEFKVFDSNGKLVWDSIGPVTIPLSYLATLKAGKTWRGNVFIPLFPNGKVLPAGTYILESSLYGTPQFSSTTSFVVNNVIAIN